MLLPKTRACLKTIWDVPWKSGPKTYLSQCTTKLTLRLVRPAKTQISLRIAQSDQCLCWSHVSSTAPGYSKRDEQKPWMLGEYSGWSKPSLVARLIVGFVERWLVCNFELHQNYGIVCLLLPPGYPKRNKRKPLSSWLISVVAGPTSLIVGLVVRWLQNFVILSCIRIFDRVKLV